VRVGAPGAVPSYSWVCENLGNQFPVLEANGDFKFRGEKAEIAAASVDNRKQITQLEPLRSVGFPFVRRSSILRVVRSPRDLDSTRATYLRALSM
jgi:hypothetical protein